MSRAKHLVERLNRLAARQGVAPQGLRILEVGSIRNEAYEDSDGHSTLYIARWVANHGGPERHRFVSIDLDVRSAARVLTAHGLEGCCELIEADAQDVLANPNFDLTVDLAYLDAADDPYLTQALLGLVLARAHGRTVVAFDDFNLSDPHQVKGEVVLPWLEAAGVPIQWADRIAFVEVGGLHSRGHTASRRGGGP